MILSEYLNLPGAYKALSNPEKPYTPVQGKTYSLESHGVQARFNFCISRFPGLAAVILGLTLKNEFQEFSGFFPHTVIYELPLHPRKEVKNPGNSYTFSNFLTTVIEVVT
jgi:hypothetical protein